MKTPCKSWDKLQKRVHFSFLHICEFEEKKTTYFKGHPEPSFWPSHITLHVKFLQWIWQDMNKQNLNLDWKCKMYVIKILRQQRDKWALKRFQLFCKGLLKPIALSFYRSGVGNLFCPRAIFKKCVLRTILCNRQKALAGQNWTAGRTFLPLI